MPQPNPRTNELIDAMNALADQHAHYVNRLSFEAATIRRHIDAVMRIDAGRGWILLGMWYAMVGDEVSARSAFQSAMRLTDDEDSHVNVSGGLAILGHFSEAQAQLAPFLLAESGSLRANIERGLQLGMFSMIADQLAIAEERGMPLPGAASGTIEAAQTAALIMREAGLTDADIGAHLDVLGEILRRHQIPAPGIGCQAINMPETFVGITMQAHIRADATTLFAMNVELAQLMQERGLAVQDRLAVLFGCAVQ